jgi:hypothetical protein
LFWTQSLKSCGRSGCEMCGRMTRHSVIPNTMVVMMLREREEGEERGGGGGEREE